MPETLADGILDYLCEIEAMDLRKNRNTLLRTLPKAPVAAMDRMNSMTSDLISIVNAAESLGWIHKHQQPALQIVLENSRRFVSGTSAESELDDLLGQTTAECGEHRDASGEQIERIFLSKLPTTTLEQSDREAQLKMLDRAWKSGYIYVMSLVSWENVGKTSLVNHWLKLMAVDNYRGAERVYGWSFYNQDTGKEPEERPSADEFINHALTWFGDSDPKAGSREEKGERLADLIRKQRSLIILDGLEPLQHPPGKIHGHLRDGAILALLRELSNSNTGLCLITTRVPVRDLDHAMENIDPLASPALMARSDKTEMKGPCARLFLGAPQGR